MISIRILANEKKFRLIVTVTNLDRAGTNTMKKIGPEVKGLYYENIKQAFCNNSKRKLSN